MAETLEQYYEAFGHEVLEEVRSQIKLNGSLAPILKRLGVPALPQPQHQHNALRQFLYKYGVFIFLKASRANLSQQDIERMKYEKISGHVHAQVEKMASKVAPAASTGAARPAAPAASKAAVPAPAAASAEQQAAPEASGPKLIKTADYEGPDRRKGQDRRKRKFGRRLRNAPVGSDRRRSSDRRQKARRAEDRAKQGDKGRS